ncbi:uncharacterized protein HKW66_Vig0153880 [Vigna angularis]|uniref:GRF-type domain-containing protein n=1 Tax=Phaseolus angularis TaxID=3914 RepID=A0A8T0JKK0_PHAAN|nr:uncharacterized protein HKW66_Vig0153880 [Vigna angularis]
MAVGGCCWRWLLGVKNLRSTDLKARLTRNRDPQRPNRLSFQSQIYRSDASSRIRVWGSDVRNLTLEPRPVVGPSLLNKVAVVGSILRREMKGDRGGCTPRSIDSGMSQTCGSSHLASKNCGCGERLLLLKATTLKNKGRLFYRCRNWASNSSCNFFEWVDEGDFEMEGSLQRKSEEVEVCIENVVLDLRKKKDK